MPDRSPFPSTSVDHVIARRLPRWLVSADQAPLQALYQALRAQQWAAERLAVLLKALPGIDAFAAPLLEGALRDEGIHGDVRQMHTVVTEQVRYPSAAEKLYQPHVTFTSRQTLLAAALHNFDEDEGQPRLLRSAHLEGAGGERLALSFERFVNLCRQLDIGARYQAQLKRILHPQAGRGQPAGQARQAVEVLFENHWRTQMAAVVHEAAIRGKLDESSYQQLIPLLAEDATAATASSATRPRQLYLLGKAIVGVITVELRAEPDSELQGVIAYIPADPVQALSRFASWDALYQSLASRLRDKGFRTFFTRFVRAQDTVAFTSRLNVLLAASGGQSVPALDGRNMAVDQPLFAHVRTQQISKIFDDARYLAVPTDEEDQRRRQERLQGMQAAGLDLLGLAGLFVPAIGELMLVVSAVQLADEVYEGYQAWQLGDREDALDHLFGVAQNLLLAGATAGSLHALKRFPFVDSLVPTINGKSVRLASSVEPVHLTGNHGVLMQDFAGGAFAGLLHDDATALLKVVGLGGDQLRRLRAEFAPPPARLLDMLGRFEAHVEYPELSEYEVDQLLQRQLPVPSTEQKALIGAFRGLTPRGAEEIVQQSSTAQLEALQQDASKAQLELRPVKVPLGMAEKARWYLHDSRLDHACLGIRLPKAINADTQKLVFGLIERKAPWPATVRVELRAGRKDGLLLFASGAEDAPDVRIIVADQQRYRLAHEAMPASDQSLLGAVLRCLDDSQKGVMGGQGSVVRNWATGC